MRVYEIDNLRFAQQNREHPETTSVIYFSEATQRLCSYYRIQVTYITQRERRNYPVSPANITKKRY